MTRRPRNEISRNKTLALRAAELLDDGMTDAAVAAKLSAEAGRRISARTVGSFRKAEYAPVAAERMQRRDAAREVELILDAARGAGASWAQAGTDLLSKMFYDLIRGGMGDLDPIKVGATLAKLRKVETDAIRVRLASERAEAAERLKAAVGDRKASPEELVAKVDEIMGLRK